MHERASVYGRALESGVAAASAREHPLARGVLWLLGSNLVYAGCQWGTVVALAKFGPAASLGYFGLALAVTNPIVLVTGFSLKAYQSSDVMGRYRFADYVNLRCAANLVAGGLIVAIMLAGVIGGEAAAVLVPVALAKLADATSETCYGLAQKHGRMRFVAVSKMVRGGLGLASLAVIVALGGSVVAGAWALAAAWLGFLLAVDLPVASTLEPVFGRPSGAVLWRLARETAPLGGVSGVVAMTQSVPRYLLQMTHGPAAVGYYTALASLGPMISQFTGAVGNAAAPRLGWAAAATHPGRYRGLVRRLFGAALVASVALALGAYVFGREFLRLAYSADYGAYWSTFALLALAAGFGIVNAVTYFSLVAARRLRLLLALHTFELVTTTIVGALLIPRLGLDGAALGAAAGACAIAMIGARILLRIGART